MSVPARRLAVIMLTLFSLPALAVAALDTAAIDQAAGRQGAWAEGEAKAYRVTFPRKELHLPPAFGHFASFVTFKGGNEGKSIVIGQLLLLPHEVNPAISAATASGLHVTALFDPLPPGQTRLYSLQFNADDQLNVLTQGLRQLLDAVHNAKRDTDLALPPSPPSNSISADPLNRTFGGVEDSADGVYSIGFTHEVAMPCACKAGVGMGVGTFFAFSGSDQRATVTGQFACAYPELQPVLKALRQAGMNIYAIGNHLDAEAPRLIFVQFYGAGAAGELAKSLKATLAAQAAGPAGMMEHHHHVE
jgi:hypothetical protein